LQPRLSKAGVQLREQLDDCYPDRNRSSDGWIGDARHSTRKSDHNPDADGWVRALDITANLGSYPNEMHSLVEEMRKFGRKRLEYIIYDGKIASRKSLWRWRKYKGINPHTKHAHFSFRKSADLDNSFWNVPMLGGSNG
jgi:hypothetical protein